MESLVTSDQVLAVDACSYTYLVCVSTITRLSTSSHALATGFVLVFSTLVLTYGIYTIVSDGGGKLALVALVMSGFSIVSTFVMLVWLFLSGQSATDNAAGLSLISEDRARSLLG